MKKLIQFLMTINLNPKMIVTALLKGLSRANFFLKVRGISQAFIDHDTLVPDLDPDSAAFKLEVDKLETLETKDKNLRQQLKSNTEAIHTQEKTINDICVDKYCKQIQNTAGMTVENVKLLGFGIKGVDDQQSPDLASVTNSVPLFDDVDDSRSLEITLTIINSVSRSFALPSDAKDLHVYEYFGEEFPADYHKATFLGSASRGKFTVHFLPEQIGQKVCIAAIYVPRKKGVSAELSGSIRSQVR